MAVRWEPGVKVESRRGGRWPALVRPRAPRSVTLAISLVVAAGLALTLYLATTSLPFMAESPTTDPLFGGHNACLLAALREPRVGFTVSPDGARVAAYGGSKLAICTRREGNDAVLLQREVRGITSAAFDFEGNLWWAVGRAETSAPSLWRWTLGNDAPTRIGDVAPVSLVGHAQGLIALDANGRLLSLSSAGEVKAFAELGGRAGDQPQLAVNADGTLVMLSFGGNIFAYDVVTLRPLLGQAPCTVQYAWWLLEAPSKLLVACEPSWALTVDVRTGEQEPAVFKERARSILVPRRGAYVQPCNALPCVASAP